MNMKSLEEIEKQYADSIATEKARLKSINDDIKKLDEILGRAIVRCSDIFSDGLGHITLRYNLEDASTWVKLEGKEGRLREAKLFIREYVHPHLGRYLEWHLKKVKKAEVSQ